MMKSILCVIDFSEASMDALKWAIELSRRDGTHLHVLYPYRLLQPHKGVEMIKHKKETEQTAMKEFEVIEKKLFLEGGISFDFKPEVGFLSDRVEDRLRKNSPDLLVMSMHVSKLNKENFEELLNNLKIPLVLVP